jgi:hypothetical protein
MQIGRGRILFAVPTGIYRATSVSSADYGGRVAVTAAKQAPDFLAGGPSHFEMFDQMPRRRGIDIKHASLTTGGVSLT